MAKKQSYISYVIEVKRVRNLDNIGKLKLGDIIEIDDRGKAVFYANSMVGLTFLGRKEERDQIYELEVVRGHRIPSKENGSILLGTILSERIYHKDHGKINSLYEDKDQILRGARL